MNPVFPSHFRTYFLVGVLFFTTNFLLAQGWQQTYPAANGYSVSKLSEGGDLFNVTLKNGPDNAFLNGFIADGNQIGFSSSAADCPIGFPGGNFQVSQLAFFNYEINANGDLRLRHIEFVPGDCGNVDQIYFDQIYDLPIASQVQVRDVIQSADGLAVFVGGTYLVVPGNAPPEAFFFVKKINAFTGTELWSYTEPTPNSTSGNVPDVRFPLAVSDGGVILMLPATPLTSSVLWRFDNDGVKVFGNVFGAGLDASVSQVIEAQDGGFFIRRFDFGATLPFPSYSKISATGSNVFQGNARNILENELNFFAQPITSATSLATSDGGFLITGKVLNTAAGDNGFYLIKLASDGSTEWVQFYDGLLPDLTHSIQTSDGGFLFAGKLNNELYLLRTDADGQISTPPAPCTNVLANPNFDNGLNGWNSTGTATENGGVGEICGAAGSLTQVMVTTPGMDYSASLSAKISGNPQSAKVVLRFLTAAYMPIPSNNDQSITSADFQTIELSATAPTGAAFVQLLVYKEANGCVLIDEAELCEGGGGGQPCEITLGATMAICNDNGTPNIPGDDFWMASIEPSGTGLGSTFSISGDIQGSNLAYGQAHLFGPFSFTPGNFQDFTITDDQNGCSKDFNLNHSSPCSNGGNYIIDLELGLEQPNANPAQYSNYAITATIYNNSVHAATGVKVSFAKPAGVVYAGGNEFTASQGSFNPNGDQVWTVGDLPGNGSATLTVNYFLLSGQAPVAYAQVTAHDQQDADSMFGNGTPPSVNEDDEASTSGGSGASQADLILTNLAIQNPTVEAGGTLAYDFNIANIGDAATNGGFLVNAYISTDFTLSADDMQEGTVVAANFAAGYSETTTGVSLLPFNLPDGNYFLILKADATDDISESNENNNLIVANFTVGTGGGAGIDLSLDFTTTSDDPVIYSSKKVILFIKNSGTETATGVKVSFPKPSETVYTGGNEYDASQGSFNPFGNEVWSVGDLAPGAEAALEVSYFFLSANNLTLYAQVTAANELDSDSTPGNGTCCVANEDDEATLSLTFFGNNSNTALVGKELMGRPVQLQAINPNPVYFGEITVHLLSRLDGQFQLECYDLFGRLASSQKVELEEGPNRIRLDVTHLESGTYYLNMPGQNWRYMPIRFVVARW
jgi:hypothetical protein